MNNPSFIKLLCAFMAIGLAYAGYLLLPQSGDLKTQIYEQKISGFLKTFHHVERFDQNERLPDAVLLSREGRSVDLKNMTKGRVTIVNFWATWCAPCLEELPSLSRFQMQNPEILVLPLSLDLKKTLPELTEYFDKDDLRDLRWFYDQDGAMRKSLNLRVYPSTYVLDTKGNILFVLQGPADWSSPEALSFGEALLSNF